MQPSEKLCLKWNEFQENLNSTFGVLRSDKEFVDVTLACEDGTQVETHKVILASSSPFFMEILKKNKHPHPLIYMRGMKADELVAMLDFLYFGEANVNQEYLDNFLLLAEELKLKGLTGSTENNCKYKTETLSQKEFVPKKQELVPNIVNSMERKQIPAEERFSSKMPVAIVGEDVQLLDEQIKSMMEIGENMVTPGAKQNGWLCRVCGKEGFRANVMTHIEAKHISSNVKHSCDICGKNSRFVCGLK